MSDHFSIIPENSPSIVCFTHAELPAEVVPLDEIDGRNPGTLCHTEVINQDGVAHVHLVERVTANLCHGNAGFWGVDGHHGFNFVNSVQHDSECVEKSLGLLR